MLHGLLSHQPEGYIVVWRRELLRSWQLKNLARSWCLRQLWQYYAGEMQREGGVFWDTRDGTLLIGLTVHRFGRSSPEFELEVVCYTARSEAENSSTWRRMAVGTSQCLCLGLFCA